MKAALAVALLASVAWAQVIKTQPAQIQADQDFLKKQAAAVTLLTGIGFRESFDNKYIDLDLSAQADRFTNAQTVKEFLTLFKQGFLPRGAVFTFNCPTTLKQTVKLFELFYSAKDYETFIKVAYWARHHINPEMFAHAFYVAVYHRLDMRGVLLPPLYEVFPNYFLRSDVMHKAYLAKMKDEANFKVDVNNSGWEVWSGSLGKGVHPTEFDGVNQHVEERLSYFREDVGLGDFIGQYFNYYPSWLDQTKYPGVSYFRRGETFLHLLQQLFARYSLERNANGLPNVEILEFDTPLKVGYNPKMATLNGVGLLSRPDNMVPSEYNPKEAWQLSQLERRIYESFDFNQIYNETSIRYMPLDKKDAMDLLGNIFLNSPESSSRSYYRSYFHKGLSLLRYLVKTGAGKNMVGSAFNSYTTVSRDPAFYSLLHRMMKVLRHYQSKLPSYTEEDLTFPGVKIDSFDVDKLVTYFDRFDFGITNSVPVANFTDYSETRYLAKAFRMNHKPFNYRLTLSSDRAVSAMVRVFVGPKYDVKGRLYSLEQSRYAFVEFDRFPVKLAVGENVVERNSKESTVYTEDSESFRSIANRVFSKQEPFYYTQSYRCGMPDRFLLPKGWKSGQPFVFYAIVTPFDKETETPPKERYFDNFVLCGGSKYYDGRSQGFPFDRSIYFQSEFVSVPNSYFKDVLVFHKDEFDLNKVAKDDEQ